MSDQNANQHDQPLSDQNSSRSGSSPLLSADDGYEPTGRNPNYSPESEADAWKRRCERARRERDELQRRLDGELHPGFVQEIMEGMAEMSGLVFWRVTGTWANNGRTGKIDDIVEAKTATEAIAIAWECEDDRDLRTIHAEWLCPIESVKRDDSLSVVGR